MSHSQNNRKYDRFDLPTVVEMPSLSDLPLVPEDISAGGFKVIVTTKPDPDQLYECSIQIGDEYSDTCTGQVAWIRESDPSPSTWIVGISAAMEEAARGRLAEAIRRGVGGPS